MRALLLAGMVASCVDHAPCRNHTLFLSLSFDDASAQADSLEVTVTSGAADRKSQVAHAPGSSRGSLEIEFPNGYPTGQQLKVQIVARREGVSVGQGVALATLSAGCSSASLEVSADKLPVDAGLDGSDNDQAMSPLLPVTVQQAVNDVDILFLIDDSPSMQPKQTALKAQFPQLMRVLDSFAGVGVDGFSGVPRKVHYHIGVVTSDLGSGGSMSVSNCKPGGLGGRLQALGSQHDPTCQAPSGGLNFIDYDQITGTNNLPSGQDLPTTFSCMAAVGQVGCGFEHQLEATYKALHDCLPDAQGNYPDCTIAENKGFLRNDALLAVVFLTDEDDCSTPPTSDLFDLDKTASYGALLSYRCTNYGLECVSGDPPTRQLAPYGDSGGPMMCEPAANPGGIGPGKLYDLSRYIDFFTKPANQGGVKIDPSYVLLTAIAAPATPVSTFIGSPSSYLPCAPDAGVDGVKCAVLLQHSCNPTATFFGDPAVRISKVVNAAAHHQETSICDTDYSGALVSLGTLIGAQLHSGCLPGRVPDPAHPDCAIQEQSVVNGQVTATQVPACADDGDVPPCWRVETNPACPILAGNPPQQLALVIEGHSGGTVPTGGCAVLSVP